MTQDKAWVVAVNMGYGHQRTAYPLRKFAFQSKVINANDYDDIPEDDKRIWESTRNFYESVSRFKRTPLLGNIAFAVFDKFQRIPSFYPKRDLSKPTLTTKRIFSLIKKGWGRDLISRLNKTPLPLITTFFTPAFMAEEFGYQGEIWCVICDADISRAWVSLEPKKSRIKYFTSTKQSAERLKMYGVSAENIFLTGYPLPQENIGIKEEILKEDLRYRLMNLDPKGEHLRHRLAVIEKSLGSLPENPSHPLTLLFSIGGAGAQKEIVIDYVKGLREKVKTGQIKLILAAGVKNKIRDYFDNYLAKLYLQEEIGRGIELIFSQNLHQYFASFNEHLRKTDILWTKPSELSFYSGLGLPILIAPSIGSQEDINRKWLLKTGAGVEQENPQYAKEWLFDYLNNGIFMEAALHGFLEVEKEGTYNIERICFGKS